MSDPVCCAKPEGPLLALIDLNQPCPGWVSRGDLPSHLAFIALSSFFSPNSGLNVGFIYILPEALHMAKLLSALLFV